MSELRTIAVNNKQWQLLRKLQRLGLVGVPFCFEERFPQTVFANRHLLHTYNELRGKHLVEYTGDDDMWCVLPEAMACPVVKG